MTECLIDWLTGGSALHRYMGPVPFDPASRPLIVDSQCGAAAGTWVQGAVRINTQFAYGVSGGWGGRGGCLARGRGEG